MQKHIFQVIAFLCLFFPVIFGILTQVAPDFLLSLPSPFSDFRSAPVMLWYFIVAPIALGTIFLFASRYKEPPR